jgi:CDP-diacylglycerol--glycerol-3-phosphate 3-phosphatidyltransferase
MKMNLPNKLTVLRVIMVPFFVFFALADFIPHHNLIAGLIFGAASYTDHLDGKIARRDNLITNFGKLMDPLADKIMVMAALICFVATGFTNVWFVLLIMVREFAVTSIRMIAVENGKVIPANNWGKAKTVSQIIAICVIFASQYVLELNALHVLTLPNLPVWETVLNGAGFVCMAFATLMAVLSGVIYAKDSAGLFKDM